MSEDVLSRKLFPIVLIMMLLTAVCLVIFPVRDYDTFWHLANGQAMWDQGRIIQEEIFSYTANGTDFSNHAWLGQVVMYFFYSLAGANGLLLFKVVLTAGIYGLLYCCGRLLGAGRMEAAVFAALAIMVGLSRFTARPQLFSYLGVAGLGAVLLGFRAGRLPQWTLISIPVGILIWDTLHGALYGYILLLAFVAGETLKVLFRRSWDQGGCNTAMDSTRFKNLWFWTAVTAVASVTSPFGLRSYEVFWAVLHKETSYSFAMTAEFMPTGWQGNFTFWLLLLFLFVALFRLRGSTLDITQLMILLPFIYLAIRYNRATAVFAMVAVPVAASCWAPFWQSIPGFRADQLGRRLVLVCFAITIIGSTAYIKFIQPAVSGGNASGYAFGLGLNEEVLPAGVSRFLQAADLRGNMYNTDRLGGFLAYFAAPERPIFHYNHPSIFKETFRFVHDSSARDKWKHNYAIVSKQPEMIIFEGWVPIYWESAAVVLVRPSAENSELINRLRIRNFNPKLSNQEFQEMLSAPLTAEVLIKEMATYLQFRQDDRIASLFGQYLAADDTPISITERKIYLQMVAEFNSENAMLDTAYGMIYYQKKQLAKARESFKRALKLNDGLTQPRLSLAYIELDAGETDEARTHFSTLLEKDTKNANAVYGLALTEKKAGNIEAAKKAFRRYLALVPAGKWADRARVYLERLENGSPNI